MQTELGKQWWRSVEESVEYAVNEQQQDGRPAISESPLTFWSLIAFTCILLLAPQQAYPVLAPLRIAMLTAVLAVLTHFFGCLARGRPVIRFSIGERLVLFLAGWSIITVPFSIWPGGSAQFLIGDYFKTITVFLLLANAVDSLAKLIRISWTLVLIAIPLALTTVKNFSAGMYLQDAQRVLGYNSALTQNPNDMALMLNLILPLAIALFFEASRTRIKIFLGFTICLIVTAIILTFSRAGFLTLGVIFFTYLWRLRNRPERFWGPLVVLGMLVALPFIPVSYTERLSTITNIETDQSGSAQTRLRDMIAATGYTIEHPVIGAGVGMNIFAMNEVRGETWTEVHNVYLEYAVDLGLPGLIMFLLLYRVCMRCTSEVLKRSAKTHNRIKQFYITEGIRVSLIAFAIEAFFHPVAYHFYFYYIAGLALAVKFIADEEQKWNSGLPENR